MMITITPLTWAMVPTATSQDIDQRSISIPPPSRHIEILAMATQKDVPSTPFSRRVQASLGIAVEATRHLQRIYIVIPRCGLPFPRALTFAQLPPQVGWPALCLQNLGIIMFKRLLTTVITVGCIAMSTMQVIRVDLTPATAADIVPITHIEFTLRPGTAGIQLTMG